MLKVKQGTTQRDLYWIFKTNREEKMKETITYNNKKIKLPCDVLYNDCEIVEEINPYSGEVCKLPRFARGVYVKIKNAEISGDYKTMQKCITWFQKHFTKEYYTLLD